MSPAIAERLRNLMAAVRGLPIILPPGELTEQEWGAASLEDAYERGRQSNAIPGTLTLPVPLIEQLAPRHPQVDREYGDCVYCRYMPKGTYSMHGEPRSRSFHAEDCPWVITRAALGDYLETP